MCLLVHRSLLGPRIVVVMSAHTKHLHHHSGNGQAKATDSTEATAPDGGIARRAYELFEERGRGPGLALDDWLRAEHQLKESTHPRDKDR